jgi:hypothetical protein
LSTKKSPTTFHFFFETSHWLFGFIREGEGGGVLHLARILAKNQEGKGACWSTAEGRGRFEPCSDIGGDNKKEQEKGAAKTQVRRKEGEKGRCKGKWQQRAREDGGVREREREAKMK